MEKTMTLQKVLSRVRQAVEDYHMIEEGDRIAVGISGGKDSLTLLLALNELRKFYPQKFSIYAVTVDLGFQNLDLNEIRALCVSHEIPYTVVETSIAKIVFEDRRENNPCSLCAKMRKGALNDAIKDLGCNKIAYAHHEDDVVETMMLSLIYEGRFSAFWPVTEWKNEKLTLIRPFIYVTQAEAVGFQHKYELPVVKNLCPADGYTRREYTKQLIRQINQENPGVKKRFFHAIETGNIEGWHKYE